ncbi:lipoprotein [Spiroplasma citri]|uniref:Lipoprotein n=1 Tax=Spiroplasma citri TaxID=2133 RepID=A0AAX3SWW9_SPICI|nr:lipoprotein [Spiroplasma citri]WFG95807.1 lipoprotein [Spiroplasma citri]WFG99689.1 lipoprotein [Spiroplasma citri]
MKKLLAMLGVANFSVVSVSSVISCKNAWNNNQLSIEYWTR